MAKKMFFFHTADNDAAAFNVDNIFSVENDADGSVHVSFENTQTNGVVELSVTDGLEDEVVRVIADAACRGGQGCVTIADDVTGTYIHSGITAVGTITPGS